jgi:hypothetical protein
MNGIAFIQLAIDCHGRLSFDEKEVSCGGDRREFDSERDWLRECVLEYCDPVKSLVSIAFKRQTLGAKTVRATNIGNVKYDHGTISFDLAPVLLIDDPTPARGCVGLALLQSFLAMCTTFATDHVGALPIVKIVNDHDRHKRTIPNVLFLSWPDPEGGAVQHAREQQMARDFAAEHPRFEAWLKARALDLNRLGPWSWVSIDSYLLFGRKWSRELAESLHQQSRVVQ